MKVYFASDHAGFDARNKLIEYVRDQLKCDVEDCGALINDPQDDYPGIIAVAAKNFRKTSLQGKTAVPLLPELPDKAKPSSRTGSRAFAARSTMVTLGRSRWTLPENIWIFSCRHANTTTQMRSPSAFGFLLSIKPKTLLRAGSQHRFPEKRATHAGLLR